MTNLSNTQAFPASPSSNGGHHEYTDTVEPITPSSEMPNDLTDDEKKELFEAWIKDEHRGVGYWVVKTSRIEGDSIETITLKVDDEKSEDMFIRGMMFAQRNGNTCFTAKNKQSIAFVSWIRNMMMVLITDRAVSHNPLSND